MPNQFIGKPPRPVIVPIGPSIAYVELTKSQYALIDREDAAWVGQWNWFAFWDRCTKHYYARRNERREGGKFRSISMHASLLGLRGTGMTADHIRPGDGLDNRRSNLRPATRTEQSQNQRLKTHNTSGFKGVSWRSDRGTWIAQIRVNRKLIKIGTYRTPEDAHAAYCAAAEHHFGEFARTK